MTDLSAAASTLDEYHRILADTSLPEDLRAVAVTALASELARRLAGGVDLDRQSALTVDDVDAAAAAKRAERAKQLERLNG